MRINQICHSTFLVGAVVMSLVFWSCSDSPTEPSGGQLSMTSMYTANAFPASVPKVSGSVPSAVAVDSVTISRVRFVLRDIEFKSETDSVNLRTNPVVLELNLLSNLQDVGVTNVPYGTFDEVEFDVHRIDSSDLQGLSSSETTQFAHFLAGERYSIIIDGTVYQSGGTGNIFQFRSKIDAQQKYQLTTPLVVSEAFPAANVTLAVSSAGWFKNSTGVLLDPTDINNQSLIDENLKASIRVFKDDDRDGSEDQ